MLKTLLRRLEYEYTRSSLQVSLVVVDNDANGSASETVREISNAAKLSIIYEVEPEQNIARARNRAVQAAEGEYVAFIDDDELPADGWLSTLLSALQQFGSDGVLGPVVPHYEEEPPSWVIRGKVFDRPTHDSGTVLSWRQTRTGNALLKRSVFENPGNRFDPAFGSGGEDREFFRRMIQAGYRFVWCQEAPVFETVPSERWKRSVLLRRALLRGQVSVLHRRNRIANTMSSVAAVVLYSLALPWLLLIGHHLFMKYLVKLADHGGRLFSTAGIRLVKDVYITSAPRGADSGSSSAPHRSMVEHSSGMEGSGNA